MPPLLTPRTFVSDAEAKKDQRMHHRPPAHRGSTRARPLKPSPLYDKAAEKGKPPLAIDEASRTANQRHKLNSTDLKIQGGQTSAPSSKKPAKGTPQA